MAERIRVPDCCDANRKHGFVQAVECHDDDMRPDPNGEFGARWQATLVGAAGTLHTIDTKHCPACGAHVVGLDLVDFDPARARL